MARLHNANTAPRWTRLSIVLLLLSLAHTVSADDYADGWGPAVGTKLPVLQAPDQTGKPRSLENLAGEQGLLLFLRRSADW